MAQYNSFRDLARAWEREHNVKKASEDLIVSMTADMEMSIQADHGGRDLKANAPLTVARKDGGHPLLDTGSNLRAAVVSSINKSRYSSEITSSNPRLQVLHEYGKRMKMTDKQRRWIFWQVNMHHMGGVTSPGSGTGKVNIPARPIWRVAVRKHKREVLQTAKNIMKKYFTN